MSSHPLPDYVHPEEIHGFIHQALREDFGDGDHSTLASVPASAHRQARIVAKEAGTVAGMVLAEWIFNLVDPDLEVAVLVQDGEPVAVGENVLTVSGNARSILHAERLVLNFMQRMSGIATTTSTYVKRIAGTNAKVLDTRKTTPGIRALEKWAVVLGGGVNHRFGLFDMVMLKDNHVDYAGGISQALEATQAYLKQHNKDLRIEVETRSLDEVEQVLKAGGADRIMLDNFTVEQTKEAVAVINGRLEAESSGGITLDTIRSYAETGVDFISVGALTHSVRSLDLSLKAM